MPKAIWKGSISFGLVNIPIKVYPATEDRKIHFTSLCPTCKNPIKYKRWCDKCEKEVKYEDLLKGFKISEENYIVIKKEELEKIKLKTTKTIEILEFIDLEQIDPIFYSSTYYLVPEETGLKAYSLFTEALRLANKVAVGKVVMRNKEYLVALRAYKKGIAMHILHYLDEIKDIEELEELKLITIGEKELNLAISLIEKLSEKEFNAEKFRDNYVDAIKKLIESKIKGEEFKEEKKEEKEAIRIMEALKESVEIAKRKKKHAI
jgi:DNA end-binding protein Ku